MNLTDEELQKKNDKIHQKALDYWKYLDSEGKTFDDAETLVLNAFKAGVNIGEDMFLPCEKCESSICKNAMDSLHLQQDTIENLSNAVLSQQEQLQEKREKISVLNKIILDSFKIGDFCSLCKNKGQILPECPCVTNAECMEHIIDLYMRCKNDL